MTGTSAAPETRPPSRPVVPRRAFVPVLATGLATNIYADFMAVVVPLWAVMLGAGPAEIGLMIGARSVLPCLLSIHGGVLMDRTGARRMMIVFSALTAGLIPLYPLLPWFPALVGLQMMTGLFANFSWIGAQTLVARIGKGDAHYLGIFAFTSRVGSIGAPVAIGLAWDMGGVWGGFGATTLVAATLFGTAVWVPSWAETGSRDAAAEEARTQAAAQRPAFRFTDLLPRVRDYTSCIGLLSIPAVSLGIVVAMLRHTPQTIQQSFYITYLNDTGLTATAIGALISFCEVPSAFGSLLAAPMMRRVPVPWLLVGVTSLTITLMTVTPFLGGVFFLLAGAQILRGTGHGLLNPAAFSFIAKALPTNAQAQGVALRTTGNRLGAVVLPIVMGAVAEAIGVGPSFLVIGGILLTIVAVLAVIVARKPAF